MRPSVAAWRLGAALWVCASLVRAQEACASDALRLNQLQFLGTHNSYHRAPRSPLVRMIPEARRAWSYEHAPLAVQLEELGVRQFELDLWVDTEGGRFARPAARGGDEGEAIDQLEAPGIKVLHVPDVDFETTCGTLRGCLEEIAGWSRAHPRHLPVMVLLELKAGRHSGPLGLTTTEPEPWDASALDAMDAEIRSVFEERELITPDQVRGEHATLEEAVLSAAWPRLDAARGRVMFCMDNAGALRALYRRERPSLEGRVLFTNAEPGSADAAFVKCNDPLGQGERIRELVRAGYVVRTRADAGGEEARANDGRRRAEALASGAHWVSTDYPRPDPQLDGGYAVRIPGGGVARGNPLSAPQNCRVPIAD